MTDQWPAPHRSGPHAWADLRNCVVSGDWFHAPVAGRLERMAGGLLEIGADGRIAAVCHAGSEQHRTLAREAAQAGRLVTLDGLLIPGLVDLHVHAPQYPQLGKGLDQPLEVWLQRYTFPLEARYADRLFARSVYRRLVADLLAGGTTTALYFASRHVEATCELADACIEARQRALVGRVVMDNPDQCPDFYRDASVAEGVAATRAVAAHIAAHPANAGWVRPVITPRFLPSCTDDMLHALGHLAGECGCHVQTHCAESDWARDYGQARFGHSDMEALDRFGLLTRHTVLAHGNFITASDMDLLARRGGAVAHCPLSNAWFANAVFPLRVALDKGVRVGLGTDIAGGPSASMMGTMRMTVAASRMLRDGVEPDRPAAERGRPGSAVDMMTAFHLATAGGGDALDLPVGRFAPGQHFDALRIDPDAPLGTMRLWGDESDEDLLATALYTASRANITHVWTDGQQTGQGPRPA
ncbi:amidohydrolase family protein [Gluconacetobacter sp.]|uniref:amidohydrolase family protein n=1 Tax=Gluconacetobacter sp. TaxID=1935994 RepID=UPI0039E85FF1